MGTTQVGERSSSSPLLHRATSPEKLLRLVAAISLVVVVSAWIIGYARQASLVDFISLYFGARRLIEGQSPYGAAATAELSETWDGCLPRLA